MDRSARRELLFTSAWFLAWGAVSSAWCLSAGSRLGATYDEPIYILRGLERWRSGKCEVLTQLGIMPLPVDVITLPLVVGEWWQGHPFNLRTQWESMLAVGRAGTLLFWWLLLLYGYKIGRTLAGAWGGRLAVALPACEPTLLAHAGLATTDVSVTALLLALAYHFRAGREAGWPWRVGVPALCFAAAVLCKVSALPFGVLCLFVVEVDRVARSQRREPAETPAAGADSPPEAAIGARGRLLRVLLAFVLDSSQVVLGGLGLAYLYCPDIVEGIRFQIQHNSSFIPTAYLLGEVYPTGVWYYFPVALAVKSSLPLLALMVLVAVLRPSALVNWPVAAAAVLLAFSLTCRVQIGVRLFLPLIALLTVGLAAAVVETVRRRSAGWPGRLLVWGTGAGLLWAATVSWMAWPHGLCYTNELWGGSAQGYRYLSDSNYDWGQGLKDLTRWQSQHGMPPLDVWYFGTDPQLSWMPVREVSPANPPRTSEELARQARGRYLAVSASLLFGGQGEQEPFRSLRTRPPAGRTMTFFIYDFTEKEHP